MLHQPFGLMSPSTCLHAFGDSKRAQPSHCCLSFDVSWYATVCLATLAALARLRRYTNNCRRPGYTCHSLQQRAPGKIG
jgi:hypothetical protein